MPFDTSGCDDFCLSLNIPRLFTRSQPLNLQRSAPVSLVFITYSFLHFLHSPFHGLHNIYFFCNVCYPAELRAPERKPISIFQFTFYLQHLSHCQAHDRWSNDIHLINRNINGYITYGPYKLESEQYNKDICNS